MKSLYLFLLLSNIVPLQVNSQTINGVNLYDLKTDYLKFNVDVSLFTNKLTVYLDYGQSQDSWSRKSQKIMGSTGTELQFNSIIDVLNFFSSNSFEFLFKDSFVIDNQLNTAYFLKRKLNNKN